MGNIIDMNVTVSFTPSRLRDAGPHFSQGAPFETQTPW
jgi:hypothetical protein